MKEKDKKWILMMLLTIVLHLSTVQMFFFFFPLKLGLNLCNSSI